MSRIHNLLQTPTLQVGDLSSTSVDVGPEEQSTKASEFEEQPVETARLAPELRIVFHTAPSSPSADRFRLLRMRLREFRSAKTLSRLLITSPLPHDGKSTISVNLASALGEGGLRRVLLIEADLHHSDLIRQLGLRSWAGLADCLERGVAPQSAIRKVEPLGWSLLPAGAARDNPTELLQAPALSSMMQTLSPLFDWILIDAPPIIPLTDALSLRQHTDASLLVIRAGRTPHEAVEKAVALLGQQHILGMVLNGTDESEREYAKYGYHGDKGVRGAKQTEEQ